MKYREIISRLASAGVEDPGFEAGVLISHFCGISAAALPLMREEDFENAELFAAVERRCGRYPLQYIIGTWDFCTEVYRVSPDCLIPRPETELLVERAAAMIPDGESFLDLCTGSGCIAVSTLARLPHSRAVAVDFYDGALAKARENALLNGVGERLDIKKCDLLASGAGESVCGGENFFALLSNPPYVKSADMACLDPELYAEPSTALDGGEDGLIFYRSILREFAPRIKDGGFMLFEAGYDTARDVAAIGEGYGFDCEVIPDLSGLDRMILMSKKGLSHLDAEGVIGFSSGVQAYAREPERV
ncbi:MAG: peptide chain release factor N(5)-glutamine methyltransferase [Clostridia bacterium]|nr:peptide chain release factor N(5)-glutamine methyltransferase [Clostridia bacterium]